MKCETSETDSRKVGHVFFISFTESLKGLLNLLKYVMLRVLILSIVFCLFNIFTFLKLSYLALSSGCI